MFGKYVDSGLKECLLLNMQYFNQAGCDPPCASSCPGYICLRTQMAFNGCYGYHEILIHYLFIIQT